MQKDRLSANLRLAERLGAEVANLAGQDVAAEIIRYALTNNFTQIVIGKPSRPRWREVPGGSIANTLMCNAGDISVHMFSGNVAAKPMDKPEPVSAQVSPCSSAPVHPPGAGSEEDRPVTRGAKTRMVCGRRHPTDPRGGAPTSRRCTMSEFHTQLRERARQALAALHEARLADDDYSVDVRTGELESIARLASEHDLRLPELDSFGSDAA